MYILATSKGKVLESGTLDKCSKKLASIRDFAANPEFRYRIDDIPNGFTVHYHTFGAITYFVCKLGEYENEN